MRPDVARRARRRYRRGCPAQAHASAHRRNSRYRVRTAGSQCREADVQGQDDHLRSAGPAARGAARTHQAGAQNRAGRRAQARTRAGTERGTYRVSGTCRRASASGSDARTNTTASRARGCADPRCPSAGTDCRTRACSDAATCAGSRAGATPSRARGRAYSRRVASTDCRTRACSDTPACVGSRCASATRPRRPRSGRSGPCSSFRAGSF